MMTLTERPERDGGGGNGRRIGCLWRNGRQQRQLFGRRRAAAHGHPRPAFRLRPTERLLATLFASRLRRHSRPGHAGRILPRIRFGNCQSPQTLLHQHADRWVSSLLFRNWKKWKRPSRTMSVFIPTSEPGIVFIEKYDAPPRWERVLLVSVGWDPFTHAPSTWWGLSRRLSCHASDIGAVPCFVCKQALDSGATGS